MILKLSMENFYKCLDICLSVHLLSNKRKKKKAIKYNKKRKQDKPKKKKLPTESIHFWPVTVEADL